MDFDTANNVLQPKVTENSKLVTIQATSLIMGVTQSPYYLSLAFQNPAEHLPDKLLQWFLQFLRYLDDLQIGITIKELIEFKTWLTWKTLS